MGIPVEGVDPPESQAEVGLSGVGDLGAVWKAQGTRVTDIGHRTLALQIAGEGTFPTSLRTSLDALAQACTTQSAALTEAGKAAIKQGQHEKTFQEQYRLATESLTKALASQQQALTAATMGGSPAFMLSAQSAVAQARSGRQTVLDNGLAGTQMNLDCLPGHAREATASVGKAQGQLTLQTGFEPSANNVTAPTAPTQVAPRVNTGGANPKPSSNTPSKPSGEKPSSENKNSVDDKGQNPQTPTGQHPPNQQGQQNPQQGQGQQGAPQGGAPTTGAPAGGQQGAKPSGIGGVPTPIAQPIRTDSGSRGGGVRPSTPPTPPSNSSPNGTGKGGVLGSGANGGTTASPAGGQQGAKPTTGIGSGAGGGTTSNSGARGPMGGMMGGAGAGHGAGGTARPKGEVKSSDPKLTGEDIAQQALGGIVRDGDDGKPVLPAPPGSNGGAPTPPPIPRVNP